MSDDINETEVNDKEISNKYNEMIEQVELTDEAKARMLKNINAYFDASDAVASKPAKNSKKSTAGKIVKIATPFAAVAAAVVLVAFVGLGWVGSHFKSMTADAIPTMTADAIPTSAEIAWDSYDNGQTNSGYTGSQEESADDSSNKGAYCNYFESLEELEAAAGFAMNEMVDGGLIAPDTYCEYEYCLASDGTASIGYLLEDQSYVYQKGIGVSDNSGLGYDETKVFVIDGTEVNACYAEDKITHVWWVKDGYVMSLTAEKGISESELEKRAAGN